MTYRNPRYGGTCCTRARHIKFRGGIVTIVTGHSPTFHAVSMWPLCILKGRHSTIACCACSCYISDISKYMARNLCRCGSRKLALLCCMSVLSNCRSEEGPGVRLVLGGFLNSNCHAFSNRCLLFLRMSTDVFIMNHILSIVLWKL